MPRLYERVKIRELFVDNRDRLQRYLRSRLQTDEDAQELAQETYLRMMRIKRTDLILNPQAYLFRIAKNLVYDLYAGHRLDCDGSIDLDSLESENHSPEETTAQKVRMKHVTRVMEELSPKCQAVACLYWQEGLTQQEISEEVGLSRSMVQKYLTQSLTYCQRRLRNEIKADRGDA